VFVVLGLPTMEQTMAAGKELAAEITKHIGCPPIKLEWEKVLWPFVITNKKKNYYGRYWTNPDYYDKLYVRGLAFIKSSTCAFMNKACEHVCEMVACEMRPMSEVLAYIKAKCVELWTIAKDRSNTALMESLLLYMKNGKEHYEIANGMTELIRKNNARGNAPIELGERVPYYVVRAPEAGMAYRVEHEAYVLSHPEMEIDVQYYVDKQWRNTLHNLMPGYEKQVDEALLPPSQQSVLSYASACHSSSDAFARYKEAEAEKVKKRQREQQEQVESSVKRAKKVTGTKRKKSEEEVPVMVESKKPRLITDFFVSKK